ncbi:preprotein translocase membrane subunit [uncultured Desulfobacterium sp.]|uniref:Protein translocase subunit SecY n=1 Tax=uncultured Desulfobacterium sp. TaxID=201089 RepID=A0A445MRX3_9BACT|nr:preprotein translocase membrane subunit [uncultured Desulfobacterium sp.]
MIGGFENIPRVPELRKKVLFTLMMLAVYRIGCHVPTPGVDGAALSAFFDAQKGSLFGLFDMFSGGALRSLSVVALGIMPYISASIILELMSVVVPYLERLKKEGEQGRKKIIQYTRYGTVILSMIQGFGIAVGLENMTSPGGVMVVPAGGMGFRAITMITLCAGTCFLMWLGEQITEKGIGNGISLIIFSGIVAGFPVAVANTFRLIGTGEVSVFFIILIVAIMLAVVGAIVFIERGQRRIPVQYAKRMVGRKMYGGQSTHLPLKINTAGVIPPIFASSIIMFPATIANFIAIPWLQAFANSLNPGSIVHAVIYVGFIFFFSYFYTAVHFSPVDVADNMKRSGGFIPGIRPGKNTAEYIDKVLARLTFAGAIYISAICILPEIFIYKLHLPFYFGGTSLLIVVGVAMDTTRQIESHLLTRHYESFMKKGFGKKR